MLFNYSSRRLSIDQLTEEAEADLANNNDPNNNSSTNEGGQDYNPVLNEFNFHEPLPATTTSQEQDGESSQGSFIDNLYFDGGASSSQRSDDEVIEDPFQKALENDVELILKLMPDRNHDEVRCLLESHQNDPKRVQVRLLSYLLLKTCRNLSELAGKIASECDGCGSAHSSFYFSTFST